METTVLHPSNIAANFNKQAPAIGYYIKMVLFIAHKTYRTKLKETLPVWPSKPIYIWLPTKIIITSCAECECVAILAKEAIDSFVQKIIRMMALRLLIVLGII